MQGEPTRIGASGVDVGALAADVQLEVAGRLASALVCAFDSLEALEQPLAQTQKIELVEEALRHFDGIERYAIEALRSTLEREGVPTWGEAAR